MALYIPHHNLLSIVSFIIFPSSPKKNSEEKMKLLNSATLILFLTMIVVSSAMDMSIISYDKNHHTVSSRSDAEVSRLYEEWLVKHGKAQNSLTEKDRRFEIFKDNLPFVDDHNAKNLSYSLTDWVLRSSRILLTTSTDPCMSAPGSRGQSRGPAFATRLV